MVWGSQPTFSNLHTHLLSSCSPVHPPAGPKGPIEPLKEQGLACLLWAPDSNSFTGHSPEQVLSGQHRALCHWRADPSNYSSGFQYDVEDVRKRREARAVSPLRGQG